MQTKPPHRPSQADTLARRLEDEIRKETVTALPSASALADHYRVARRTVLAACRKLRDRGILEYTQGRKMHVVARSFRAPPAPVSEPAGLRLYHELHNDITEGALRVGSRLPKAAYYARAGRLAERTVRGVYRRLISEGLLHQAGRAWVVGPRPDPRPSISMRSTPIVAVVLPHVTDWRSLAYSDRTRDFCAAFSNESTRHRIRLAPFPIIGDDRSVIVGHDVIGRIKEDILAIGHWHLGTLVVYPPEAPELLACLLNALLGIDKPLVWLDHVDTRNAPQITHAKYIRCRFSESSGILSALEFLAAAGHRCLGYLGRSVHNEWEAERMRTSRRLARHRRPAMTITRCASSSEEFGMPVKPERWPTAMDRVQNWVAATGGVSPKERIAIGQGVLTHSLLSHGRQFEDLLRCEPNITAIVASNQYRARELHSYLRWKGIKVPEDISIITFDNYLQFQVWPLTTVDFGFGNLGYCAFHAIRGDLPTRISRDRSMPTVPRVINRGSVDAPRRGALRIR